MFYTMVNSSSSVLIFHYKNIDFHCPNIDEAPISFSLFEPKKKEKEMIESI